MDLTKLCGNLVPPGTAPAGMRQYERTAEQQALHEACVAAWLPDYSTRRIAHDRTLNRGETIDWGKLVELHAPAQWVGQRTGSCVGTNSFNILMVQSLVEAVVRQTGEEIDVDYWWPYSYGWGRYFGGMIGKGDGSYLSVQHKAFKEKGIPHLADASGLRYDDESGARWVSASTEYDWSRKSSRHEELDDEADDHLVLDGTLIRTVDDVRDALMVGPIGYAGMLGSSRIYEKHGVRLSDWTDNWSHCMGFDAMQHHPELGFLYRVMNRSWTPSGYSWFWITERTLEQVVRDGATELAKWADFDGVEAEGIDLELLYALVMSW